MGIYSAIERIGLLALALLCACAGCAPLHQIACDCGTIVDASGCDCRTEDCDECDDCDTGECRGCPRLRGHGLAYGCLGGCARVEPGPPPVTFRPTLPGRFLPVPTQPVYAHVNMSAPTPMRGFVETDFGPQLMFPGRD